MLKGRSNWGYIFFAKVSIYSLFQPYIFTLRVRFNWTRRSTGNKRDRTTIESEEAPLCFSGFEYVQNTLKCCRRNLNPGVIEATERDFFCRAEIDYQRIRWGVRVRRANVLAYVKNREKLILRVIYKVINLFYYLDVNDQILLFIIFRLKLKILWTNFVFVEILRIIFVQCSNFKD